MIDPTLTRKDLDLIFEVLATLVSHPGSRVADVFTDDELDEKFCNLMDKLEVLLS